MLNDIKQIRLKAGLTQEQLADISDVAKRSIEKYEAQQGNPTYLILKKLATALNCQISDFNIRTTDCENERKESVIHLAHINCETERINKACALEAKARYTLKQCNTELIDMVVKLKTLIARYGYPSEYIHVSQAEFLIKKATELNRNID